MIIREYKEKDEKSWVKCRVLSFLNTSYFDDVFKNKEMYKNPSLCIVAEENNEIIGLLDIEHEDKASSVCYLKGEKGAVIWNLAVLPEYRNNAIASKMWNYAIERLKNIGIKRVEVWTQDDIEVNNWYVKQGFKFKESYLNAYIKGKINSDIIQKYVNIPNIGNILGIRCFNFEAPIERKKELEKICYRLHEVKIYELKLS